MVPYGVKKGLAAVAVIAVSAVGGLGYALNERPALRNYSPATVELIKTERAFDRVCRRGTLHLNLCGQTTQSLIELSANSEAVAGKNQFYHDTNNVGLAADAILLGSMALGFGGIAFYDNHRKKRVS
jgi:hypothetical protein